MLLDLLRSEKPRRTNKEKREDVLSLLNSAETSNLSSRALAKICGVSYQLVNNIRNELLTVNNCQPQTSRTYLTKHGVISTMNIAKIVGRNAQKTPEVQANQAPNIQPSCPKVPCSGNQYSDDARRTRSDRPSHLSSGNQYSDRVKEGKRIRAMMLLLICKNPGLTAEEIAQRLDRSVDRIYKHLHKLNDESTIHSKIHPGEKSRRYYAGARDGR